MFKCLQFIYTRIVCINGFARLSVAARDSLPGAPGSAVLDQSGLQVENAELWLGTWSTVIHGGRSRTHDWSRASSKSKARTFPSHCSQAFHVAWTGRTYARHLICSMLAGFVIVASLHFGWSHDRKSLEDLE